MRGSRDADKDREQNDDAEHGEFIFSQTAHSVAEESRGLAHDFLLLFLPIRSLLSHCRIQLHAESALFRCFVGIILIIHKVITLFYLPASYTGCRDKA